VFYWILKVILSPFLRTFWRPWVEGLENVPAEGPAILASNHLSFLDSIFLPLMVPRRVTFLAKIDYFTQRGLKGRAKRMFFSGVGQLPIDRSGGKASDAALRSAVRVLAGGQLLGIYPEGTRSPDGRLYRGKVGVARMALEARVQVIPVAMLGTFEVQPQGRTVPKIRRVGIRIGRPLDFSRYEDMADDRFVLRSITDEIMYELMQLSGQEYVDMYAQRAKEDLAAARAVTAAVDHAANPSPQARAVETLPPSAASSAPAAAQVPAEPLPPSAARLPGEPSAPPAGQVTREPGPARASAGRESD
jgi:1-acyl-sn-glycerol-3-phosphate acyltransferase